MKIRASSLSSFLQCQERWKAFFIDSLRLPTSGAAQLGTAVHAGTALYDQSRIDHSSLTIDDCIGAVVEKLYYPEEEVDWEDSSPKQAEPIATALHKLYCKKISPSFTYVAVEAHCDSLEIPELDITLTGTTDRVWQAEDGQLGIADLKTGKSAVAADGTVKVSGHGAQMGAYELLAWKSLGKPITLPACIIGLQVAKTDSGRRAGIGEIKSGRQILAGDQMHKGLLEIMAATIKSGDFLGNPASNLCSEKYCPCYHTCRWR